jgi:hypothetical protein
MSLRARLLLTLIPLFVVGLAVADIGTYTALRSSLVGTVDTQISSNRGAIERLLEGTNFGPGPGPGPGDGRGGGPDQYPQYTYGAATRRARTRSCRRTTPRGSTPTSPASASSAAIASTPAPLSTAPAICSSLRFRSTASMRH